MTKTYCQIIRRVNYYGKTNRRISNTEETFIVETSGANQNYLDDLCGQDILRSISSLVCCTATINNQHGVHTMRQLSLFSLEELAECYLATKVVQKVRASLRKPSNVIKFPVKKVS